jgi:hypothetical protein
MSPSTSLSFQLFRASLFQPELAYVFPPYSSPSSENCFQVIQIFRFQKIFLGSLLKYRKALRARSDELLKNPLLAWFTPYGSKAQSA